MNPSDRPPPLRGEQRRQAIAALHGYVYQLWSSLDAWLEISDDQLIFLEGAEDFDLLARSGATAVQVKTSSHRITLRSPEVIAAINHFWKLRESHPTQHVFFRFLTTSEVGTEQGNPFGDGIGGLLAWERARSDSRCIPEITRFLEDLPMLTPEVQAFLAGSTVEEVRSALIEPMSWITCAPTLPYLKDAVHGKLIQLGDRWDILPSEAMAAADHLLGKVIDVAIQPSDRYLDRSCLLRVFEEATFRKISPQQLRRLSALESAFQSGSLVPVTGALTTFAPSTPIGLSLPPPLAEIEIRSGAVSTLRAHLSRNRVVFISGSVGMGKTTLAQLLIAPEVDEWQWIGLSRGDPEASITILSQAFSRIYGREGARKVVLDGVEFVPHTTPRLEGLLGGILYTVMQRGGQVILTTTSEVPDRLIRNLGLDADSIQPPPPFTDVEIHGLATGLGCPTERHAGNWANVLLLHTQGHPTLVHAGLLQLRRDGWPGVVPNNLLTPLDDLLQEREYTRKLLGVVLRSEERELLYRLSLRGGPVRRDQALAIASIEPAIPLGGDVFDGLVGPWIERLGDEYYRLSPLIDGAGTAAWDPDTVARLRGSVGRAILRAGRLTSLEAGGVLMMALVADDGDLVTVICNSLLNAAPPVWKAVCQQHPWIAHIFPDPDRAPFPHHGAAAFLVRMLQFRVAADTQPTIATAVVTAWGAEIQEGKHRDAFLLARLGFAVQVLIRYQVEIPASTVVSLLCEVAAIQEEIPALLSDLRGLSTPITPSAVGTDPVGVLASILPARCTTAAFLAELLGALEGIPEATRSRILQGIASSAIVLKLLFNRPWLRETDRSEPDWDSCRKVFERAVDLGRRWQVASFGAFASLALAVVLDEYVGRPEDALEVLDAAEESFGDLPDLRDGRATVYLHQKRYGDALACWERALSSWAEGTFDEDDLTPMFAYRKAGIAAAELEEWNRAQELFLGGYQIALRLRQRLAAAAFLGDAAFALWQVGRRQEAVRHLEQATERIEACEAEDGGIGLLWVKKAVGYLVAWGEQEITGMNAGFVRPVPGMCSNPERDERVRDLPNPPIALGWALLADLGVRCGDDAIVERVRSRQDATEAPAARYLFANVGIRVGLRTGRVAEVLRRAATMCEAQGQMEIAQAAGGLIWEKPDVDTATPASAITVFPWGWLLVVTVLVERAHGASGKDALLGWRDVTGTQHAHEDLRQLGIGAEGILFDLSIAEVGLVMKDEKESSTRRLLAALRLGSDQDVGPEDMFYAHALLLDAVAGGAWAEGVVPSLEVVVVRRWAEMIRNPAVLLAPGITVPAIRAACDSTAEGIAHTSQVLHAAMNAVWIRNRAEVAQNLRRYAPGTSA